MTLLRRGAFRYLDTQKITMSQNGPLVITVGIEKHSDSFHVKRIADIYISISMETFEHRKYIIRGDDGNN